MAIAQITVISAWLPRLIDRHEPMDIKQDKNMEFVLTMVLIVLAPAALLSGAVMTPVYRLNRPYAKPIAIVMGLILFAALSWLIFVLLLVWSAQQGHPF